MCTFELGDESSRHLPWKRLPIVLISSKALVNFGGCEFVLFFLIFILVIMVDAMLC